MKTLVTGAFLVMSLLALASMSRAACPTGCTLNGLTQPATGNYDMGGNGLTNLQSIAPKSLNGTALIGQYSVNGVLNVKAYGTVSGSSQNTTGTINASSNSLALALAIDFANGQGIAVAHAGIAQTGGSAPTTPTVAATCSGTCATGYTYKVAALDGKGGETIASSASTSVNNAVTLDATHYNIVTITPAVNVESYAVYRGTSLIAFAINTSTAGFPTIAFTDNGQSALGSLPWVSATPPASALADALVTTISSGGGTTTLTLAVAATTTATTQAVYHDDSVAINAAISAAGNAGTVFVPVGQYYIASSLRMTQIKGVMLQGGGSDNNTASSATQIISLPTLAGLPELFLWNCYSSGAKDLSIYGNLTAPPIAGVETRSANPGAGLYAHRLLLSNIYINGRPAGSSSASNGSSYGVAWTADPGYDDQNDMADINNVDISNVSVAAYYTGHNNAEFEHVTGGIVEFVPVAYLSTGGDIQMADVALNVISDTAFWLRASQQQFSAADQFVNVKDESVAGQILRIDSTVSSPRVNFVDYYKYSSSTSPTSIIDVQGTYAAVSFVSCDINRFGNPNWTAQFTDTHSSVQFFGGVIGLKTINYAGTLTAHGVAVSDVGFTSGLTALNSAASADIEGLSVRLLTGGAEALISFKSPEVLSAFGTCSGSSEGRVETETNSTAACSAGAIATSGGTTHCQIYCNGSNWRQTGR